MSSIEYAIHIARSAHRGQTDKAGKPFIGHPLRVGANVAAVGRFDLVIPAVLHDTVEDTPVTLAVLEALGFDSRAVELVDLMTRRDDETYFEYIDRLAVDKDARVIKRADLKDNMDPTRGDIGSLMLRYEKTIRILNQKEDRNHCDACYINGIWVH